MMKLRTISECCVVVTVKLGEGVRWTGNVNFSDGTNAKDFGHSKTIETATRDFHKWLARIQKLSN